jgi:branched-chain amino acid aminotransferase
MAVYYVDGKFVPQEEAVLPLGDLAILRGYGVFDFLRTYGGRPFHLDAHIRRLENSAKLIKLSCPWSQTEISEIVHETMKRNEFAESNIRLLITGGDSDDSITPGSKPRLLVMISPLKQFPDQWYKGGVHIITTHITRYIPGAKSIDYIRAIMALDNAQAAGAVESLYVDGQGLVLEGTTSNLFAVIKGQLITPSIDILPGVTRDVVLDLTAPEFKPELKMIQKEDILAADELFLTSSNKEVLPVTKVDGMTIGSGRPGPKTTRAMELFASYTKEYAAGLVS